MPIISGKYLNVPVLVVPKVGGGGAVAAAYVKSVPADGYTIIMMTPGVLTKTFTAKMNYAPEDFTPVNRIVSEPYVFVMKYDAPWKDLRSFLDEAKKNPKKYKYTAVAAGTLNHLTAEKLMHEAGAKVVHVPYTGYDKCVLAVLRGDAQLGVVSALNTMNLVEAKKLRVVAVSSPIFAFPDAPTLVDAGYDVTWSTWRGAWVSNKTPKERIKKLESIFKNILADEDFNKLMKKLGVVVSYIPGESETKTEFKKLEEMKALAKELGYLVK